LLLRNRRRKRKEKGKIEKTIDPEEQEREREQKHVGRGKGLIRSSGGLLERGCLRGGRGRIDVEAERALPSFSRERGKGDLWPRKKRDKEGGKGLLRRGKGHSHKRKDRYSEEKEKKRGERGDLAQENHH